MYLEYSTQWLPASSQVYQKLAEAYALSGRASQVLDALSRATELDPGNGMAQLRLGQWCAGLGDLECAVAAWRQGQVAQLVLWQGKSLLESGQLDDAELLLGLAVAAGPELAEAHWLLADVQRMAGEKSLAAQSYRQASRLTGRDTDTHHSLLARAYWMENDLRRAIEGYERAIALNPSMPVYYFELSTLYFEAGQTEEAIQVLISGVEEAPDYYLHHRLLGDLLRHEDRCQEAIYWYEQAIRIDEQQFSPWLGIGLCKYDEGSFEQAVRSFRKAETRNPQDANLHYWLGQSLAQLGDLQEAEKELMTAISMADDFRYHLALGDLYYRVGEARLALDQYVRVLEIQPDNPTVVQRVQELSD
jgi:tetratricopeptide (TPR) repeat protein